MAVTIREIAEQAGVSLTTVGIALGRPGRISDKTRKKILLLAEELGYRPNRLVHGIQTGRSMTVGLLARVDSLFNGQMFTGAHDVLSDADYATIVMSTTERHNELHRLHSLIDRRVDGILIVPFFEAMWDKHLNELISRDIPVVSLDVEVQGNKNNIDFVGTDNFGGGYRAAEQLVNLGHRSAIIVTSGTDQQPPFLRTRGFRDAFKKSGGECHTISVPWISSPIICDEVCRLLKQKRRPTCVFMTTDLFADRVYEAARVSGLDIPRDLSVIGFSGDPVGRYLSPPLATFRQDPFAIGRCGAEILIKRMRGETNTKRIKKIFTPKFFRKNSICTAPK
ncbi:MAG: LacI family DNA-binding transcriptional regulator [Planctomycetota bacterium]